MEAICTFPFSLIYGLRCFVIILPYSTFSRTCCNFFVSSPDARHLHCYLFLRHLSPLYSYMPKHSTLSSSSLATTCHSLCVGSQPSVQGLLFASLTSFLWSSNPCLFNFLFFTFFVRFWVPNSTLTKCVVIFSCVQMAIFLFLQSKVVWRPLLLVVAVVLSPLSIRCNSACAWPWAPQTLAHTRRLISRLATALPGCPRAVPDSSSPHWALTSWLPSWLGPLSPQACLVIWALGWLWLLALDLPCSPCSPVHHVASSLSLRQGLVLVAPWQCLIFA